jgi:beta-glucosidase
MGFSGFVVSDWAAIHELIAHGVAADGAEAARKALLAGVDMDLGAGLYDRHLADEVRAERVPIAAVDEAVAASCGSSSRWGCSSGPTPIRPGSTRSSDPESRRAAREVAREAIVLLQNRDNLLPIAPATRSIALIGSLAAHGRDQLGPHAARGHVEDTVTILEGLRQRAAAAGVSFTFAPGCDVKCSNQDGFAEAVAAARAADVVVVVVGEAEEISGEAASRAHLALPGHQRALVEALAATGKPVALVLAAAGPSRSARCSTRPRPCWSPGSWATRAGRRWPKRCSATSTRAPSSR